MAFGIGLAMIRQRFFALPLNADKMLAADVRHHAATLVWNGGFNMEFHRGRLLDHVHLRVRDLNASKAFYRAALHALGKDKAIRESEEYFSADELWIDVAAGPVSHVHIAFQAANREQVAAFHAAVLAAGGRDNGAPGERQYHPGYYAAFALDPDGNNIEAVYHGPFEASAESVVVRPAQEGKAG
jgi:catechol 2,3-dioxygenase-like lactoylglutathione lyase family enzyme